MSSFVPDPPPTQLTPSLTMQSWQLLPHTFVDTSLHTPAAVTPGSIGEQQTVHLARWEDFAFNRGIMNHFLGLYAKDGVGKTSVGNGVLYVTNGFE